jgi:hypothetical protein
MSGFVKKMYLLNKGACAIKSLKAWNRGEKKMKGKSCFSKRKEEEEEEEEESIFIQFLAISLIYFQYEK